MPDPNKLLKNGRGMLLAYDQGFEHGPTDFNEKNVDPSFILHIALEAQVFTGLVLQKGLAQSYYPIGGVDQEKMPPLIVKLNGKTALHKGEEPYSPQVCTVEDSKKLGAVAVGYTIYVGSEHEAQMMHEFSAVVDEAHANDLLVVAWMYPRGKHVEGKENDRDTIAYAARLGLELGADFVKLPYTGDPESFSWVVKSAGKTKVFVQGGTKIEEAALLKETQEVIKAGAVGLAIGRNVWQAEDPVRISKKLAEIVYAI